jgi:hypothetical protein
MGDEQLGEYMTVNLVKRTEKTCAWEIKSAHHGDVLGTVKWNPAWRQYTFFPTPDTTFSSGCMTDITSFIERSNVEHRSKAKALNEMKRSQEKA